MASTNQTLDRIHGSILGLAVGDAIGLTVESQPIGSFERLHDMIGGGKFRVLPGQWTDDTSMALCVAESVVECQGYQPIDQLTRFCGWYEGWHMNCCGELIDIGEDIYRCSYFKTRSIYRKPLSIFHRQL